MIKHSLILVAALAALSGCGKDRTIEDWRRDKVSEQLAHIQAVAGTYRGILVAGSSGSALGAVELSVQPDARVSTGRDAQVTEAQAGLQGSVRMVVDGETRLLSFRDGFFDYNTGDFKAESTVTLRAGGTAAVQINGTFREGAVTGRIEVAGFPEYGATFDLARDAAAVDPASLVSGGGGGSGRGMGGVFQSYEGQADFTAGGHAAMEMTLMVPAGSSDQDFADVLTPLKWVDITLLLNNRTSVLFRGAQWDQRTEVLFGQTEGESGNQRERFSLTLRCQRRDMGRSRSTWSCAYWSNRQGLLFKAIFQPKGT